MVERLTRGVVLKRRLPLEFGRRSLYVAADAALGYLRPRLPHDDLFEVATRFIAEGDCVWDVGANVGLFTFAAAHRAGAAGEVIAVEADIWLANLIRRSARLSPNRQLPIKVLPLALSNTVGILKFMIADRGRASNALEQTGHRSQAGGVRRIEYVPSMTLDLLLESFRPPQFIKIDVEGAEESVLTGASRTLSAHRPTIYCEVGREQSPAVTAILMEHGYRLFSLNAPGLCAIDQCCFNTMAIPEEKLQSAVTGGELLSANASASRSKPGR